MSIDFQVTSLSMKQFSHFFALPDHELFKHNAKILVADKTPGYPCRVSLVDAEIGERVLLIPFSHHDVKSPYRSSGPIFVREKAKDAIIAMNEIPKILETRLLSIRAYNKDAIMMIAEVVEGGAIKNYIKQVFENNNIEYLHVHNARPGCFSCRINRI